MLVPEENIEELRKVKLRLQQVRKEIVPILEKKLNGFLLSVEELSKFEMFNSLRGRYYDLID
jgi:hypothetical protein